MTQSEPLVMEQTPVTWRNTYTCSWCSREKTVVEDHTFSYDSVPEEWFLLRGGHRFYEYGAFCTRACLTVYVQNGYRRPAEES